MNRIKKARAANTGGGTRTRQASLTNHNPIIPQAAANVNNENSGEKAGALSSLIDQALFHLEEHEHAAWQLGEKAAFHRAEAEKHRAILHQLEQLIPGAAR